MAKYTLITIAILFPDLISPAIVPELCGICDLAKFSWISQLIPMKPMIILMMILMMLLLIIPISIQPNICHNLSAFSTISSIPFWFLILLIIDINNTIDTFDINVSIDTIDINDTKIPTIPALDRFFWLNRLSWKSICKAGPLIWPTSKMARF